MRIHVYTHTYSYMNNTYIYSYLYIYLHTHMIPYVNICVTVQYYSYYSLYRTDPCVAIPMNQPVFHKISGCHWHAIGYGGHRPLRLLRLSRL